MKKAIITLFLLSLVALSASAQNHKARNNLTTQDKKAISKIEALFNDLDNFYIDSLNYDQLVDSALVAILRQLDPHSRYRDKKQAVEDARQLNRELNINIGLEAVAVRDTLRVSWLLSGGAAQRAGIQLYDKIVSIDGVSVVGTPWSDVESTLFGDKGKQVSLAIIRDGVQLSFAPGRETSPNPTVFASQMLTKEVGYIKVQTIARSTVGEFRTAFRGLNSPDFLILDMRGNRGGYLEQSVGMAGFFLPKGSHILSTRNRDRRKILTTAAQYSSAKDGESLDSRLIVLIDKMSASATEIVIGALQDWDRAVLVGRRSYGKGLMQGVLSFSDGSTNSLTVSEYTTPTGRSIQRAYVMGDKKHYDELFENRSISADTIAGTDSLLLYKTLKKGRSVYGNGGIYPDIYVDNSNHPYVDTLLGKHIFNEYAIDLLVKQRDSLLIQYPDFESFKQSYTLPDNTVSRVILLALDRKVPVPESIQECREGVQRETLLAICRYLWGRERMHELSNLTDVDILRSLELVERWESESPIL